MRPILIQLDDSTHRALNQVAPAKSRRRSEFIRAAIRKAIREAEYARMRGAYKANPDSESEADAWVEPEEFRR